MLYGAQFQVSAVQ